MAQFEEQGRLSTLVHLEVESFYIFAKSVLDKLAMFIERYFGLAQGCSLASHDKLRKNYDRYGRAKGLVFPESFGEKVIFLKEHVCDFRDKQIRIFGTLEQSSASLFGVHRQVRIAVVPFFPNERELDREQVESRELSELIGAIDAYMCCVMDLVLLNRERTVFSLKE